MYGEFDRRMYSQIDIAHARGFTICRKVGHSAKKPCHGERWVVPASTSLSASRLPRRMIDAAMPWMESEWMNIRQEKRNGIDEVMRDPTKQKTKGKAFYLCYLHTDI